jgi:glycosidase
MVDRFRDSKARTPVNSSQRSSGSGTLQQLRKFCGGTLKGVTDHLDYIEQLGCTSLWLSPVFENNDAPDPNSDKYHGYSIQNYLDVDPRFGTKQDLIDLVDAAHSRNMRVFLDVVTNHSGDNWAYPDDNPYFYFNDIQFPFGKFRRPDRPLPKELQNPNFYHRRGQIRNWDDLREAQRGDFFTLKDFNNDEDSDGLQLIDILVRAHCYWIREADIDGFRMDAVKHMGAIAVGADCPDDQIIAGIGYLLCALGTPCIYYGTEQGFSGKGNDDAFIREAMFDLQDPQKNFLNQNCRIYNETSKIAILFSDLPPLRFGRMYFREISGNGIDFGLPQGNPCTLAFSRILADQEVSVAYNTSTTDQRQDFVIVDSIIQGDRPHMSLLYSSRGRSGDIALHQHPNSSRFVQLVLDPMEFAILM